MLHICNIIELDKINDSDTIQYVTTQDFKIKNKNTNKYIYEKSIDIVVIDIKINKNSSNSRNLP